MDLIDLQDVVQKRLQTICEVLDKIWIIIRNTVLCIHADLRSLDKSKVSRTSMDRLMQLDCWSLTMTDSFNFFDTMRCLIPKSLLDVLLEFGCSLSQATNIILVNLDYLFKTMYKDIWIPRCKLLVACESKMGIYDRHKKKVKGHFKRINPLNLVFPVIRYTDNIPSSRLHNDYLLWHIWVSYACKNGKSWQDF